MRFLRLALAAALTAISGYRANGQDAPLPAQRQADEEFAAPRVEGAGNDVLQTESVLQGSGIPYTPYPAGLSYMMTPQPFRVPYPNRFYYPPARYVRQCPYYPKGVYWGADWNKHLLGCNPWLIHGDKRFNPYLTAAKIRHHVSSSHAGTGPHADAPCVHCQEQALSARGPAPEISKQDEFEIPPAPVPSRSVVTRTVASRKKIGISQPLRSSLTMRVPSETQSAVAELAESELADADSADAEPDASEPVDDDGFDEFALPAKPATKRPASPARKALPAWQRAPAVRR